MSARAFDDNRVLCADGGCIGVIGGDGKCRECGLAGAAGSTSAPKGEPVADRPDQGADHADADDDGEYDEDEDEYEDDDYYYDDDYDDDDEPEDGDDDEDDRDKADPVDGNSDVDRGDDFDSRQLCPDGGCVGLIGKGGRCSACGKRTFDEKADEKAGEEE